MPSGNVAGASLLTLTAPSTRSEAVAVPIATVLLTALASTDTSAGAVITGAVVSVTVTVCVPTVVRPLPSVAV